MIKVYHNNRCGKSREAIQFLEKSGKEFEIVKYLEKPLIYSEIEDILKKLHYQPIDLVRQKESIWIAHFKQKGITNSDIIKALAEYPILMERPIVVVEDKAIVARPVEKLNGFI